MRHCHRREGLPPPFDDHVAERFASQIIAVQLDLSKAYMNTVLS
jgi:hypothetical protein